MALIKNHRTSCRREHFGTLTHCTIHRAGGSDFFLTTLPSTQDGQDGQDGPGQDHLVYGHRFHHRLSGVNGVLPRTRATVTNVDRTELPGELGQW